MDADSVTEIRECRADKALVSRVGCVSPREKRASSRSVKCGRPGQLEATAAACSALSMVTAAEEALTLAPIDLEFSDVLTPIESHD